MLKHLIFIFCVLLVFSSDKTRGDIWQAPAGHMQIPIWPQLIPDVQRTAKMENVKVVKDHLIGGNSWLEVGQVTQPTMTIYFPKEKNTGVAIVVFPGGGYTILAMDLEGTEVCDWLTSKGVACILLKYRVPGEGLYLKSAPYPKSGPYPESPIALEDAQRTMGLVRFNATKWHINPNKIGVLGFSAGGHLVAAISTHFKQRLYKAIDIADKESCRPDFAIAIYPGHLSMSAVASDERHIRGLKKISARFKDNNFELNPNILVTHQTPSTFLLQAENDNEDNVNNSLVYYIALKKAKVPVEMHLYAEGGHAFGLRPTNDPITQWPQLVETWLGTIGMITK